MKDKLIILGAGDLGREIRFAAQDCNIDIISHSFETIAFVDDDEIKIGTELEGVPVISFDDIEKYFNDKIYFICGTGSPCSRKNMTEKLLGKFAVASFAKVVHKSVVVMPNVIIQEGVYIAPNTTIATGSIVGQHVAINQNVSLGHDCILDEFVVISPGCILSGRTHVGENTFLGSNVTTYPQIEVGINCDISAATVLSRKVKDNLKIISKPNTMSLPK